MSANPSVLISQVPSQRAGKTYVDGRWISWRRAGEGRHTLLFIHGWCCGQDIWRYAFEHFAGSYNCVSLDWAGHGETSEPRNSRCSLSELAEDIVSLRSALGLENVVFVGHSLGGPLAIEAAITNPQGVAAVIGVDTFSDELVYAARPAAEIADRLAILESDFTGSVESLLPTITRCDALGIGVVAEMTSAMKRCDTRCAIGSMRALLEWDIEDRLMRVLAPKRAINSAELVPLIKTMPDRSDLVLRMMDGVGHFPMLEDPVAFNLALEFVLSDLRLF